MVNPYLSLEDLDDFLVEKLSNLNNLDCLSVENFRCKLRFTICVDISSKKIVTLDISSLPILMTLSRTSLVNYFSNGINLENTFIRTLVLLQLKLRFLYFNNFREFGFGKLKLLCNVLFFLG